MGAGCSGLASAPAGPSVAAKSGPCLVSAAQQQAQFARLALPQAATGCLRPQQGRWLRGQAGSWGLGRGWGAGWGASFGPQVGLTQSVSKMHELRSPKVLGQQLMLGLSLVVLPVPQVVEAQSLLLHRQHSLKNTIVFLSLPFSNFSLYPVNPKPLTLNPKS